jgi:hypothetical protein
VNSCANEVFSSQTDWSSTLRLAAISHQSPSLLFTARLSTGYWLSSDHVSCLRYLSTDHRETLLLCCVRICCPGNVFAKSFPNSGCLFTAVGSQWLTVAMDIVLLSVSWLLQRNGSIRRNF